MPRWNRLEGKGEGSETYLVWNEIQPALTDNEMQHSVSTKNILLGLEWHVSHLELEKKAHGGNIQRLVSILSLVPPSETRAPGDKVHTEP